MFMSSESVVLKALSLKQEQMFLAKVSLDLCHSGCRSYVGRWQVWPFCVSRMGPRMSSLWDSHFASTSLKVFQCLPLSHPWWPVVTALMACGHSPVPPLFLAFCCAVGMTVSPTPAQVWTSFSNRQAALACTEGGVRLTAIACTEGGVRLTALFKCWGQRFNCHHLLNRS